MDNKGHIVLSCDTLGTTVPEARQNLQMSSPTLTMDNIENVDEQESLNYPNNCEDSSERLQSSEYVNYYDNESYVLEHLKTEFPEDILPQSDCSVNSKIHCENKELLKFDAKAEINDENTEDGLLLNIKKENDCNEYRFIVKTEGLEEQEDVQSEFCDKTLNNGCNLLQNSNKHVKVEINTPVDNGITELHRCQYCGKGFGNYNNVLVHISNEHKQDKSKCDICEKQFKSVGNLNRHILAFHQLDKLNEHPKLPRSGKEDGEDESGNKVTKNITTYDYGPILECSYKKPVRSRIHLREHQKLRHRPKIPKTNNGTFQCDSCKNFYKTKHILITHIERVHYDYGKRFECRCGKQFRTPFHLRQHEKNVHRDTLQNTNDGKFQCDYCKFFFKTKMYLLGHIKRLHRDYGKRFDCWCGKQFRSPMNLYEHERLLHVRNNTNSNYGKFQCDYCKVFLSTKSNILIHIKRLHHDYGKRFDCWCGKQFRSPLDLRGHEKRIHNRNVQNTNNGKFQCDYCKYFFKTKIILFGHIKRLHYDYGKRFDCWCGKQFRSPIHLREHERIMQHRKVNNNGKFQCDYCKIFLKTKANVLTHIKRLHYDYGKQFDCWCGKQFRSPMHLYDHKRKTHQRDDKEK